MRERERERERERGSSPGVMVNVLDCGFDVGEVERNYVHFRLISIIYFSIYICVCVCVCVCVCMCVAVNDGNKSNIIEKNWKTR